MDSGPSFQFSCKFTLSCRYIMEALAETLCPGRKKWPLYGYTSLYFSLRQKLKPLERLARELYEIMFLEASLPYVDPAEEVNVNQCC